MGEESNAILYNACYGIFKANNPIDALEQAKKKYEVQTHIYLS